MGEGGGGWRWCTSDVALSRPLRQVSQLAGKCAVTEGGGWGGGGGGEALNPPSSLSWTCSIAAS